MSPPTLTAPGLQSPAALAQPLWFQQPSSTVSTEFVAVGGITQATSSTFTLATSAPGDLVVVIVLASGSTSFATALSSSNVNWQQLTSYNGFTHNGGGSAGSGSAATFAGTVTSASSATVTVTWSGATPGTVRVVAQEFYSVWKAWVLDSAGNVDSTGTANFPSLPATASGELYFGFALDKAGIVAGSTSGFTYFITSNSNGVAYNPACGSGNIAPTWGASTQTIGQAVLIKPAPAPVSFSQPYSATTTPPGLQSPMALARPVQFPPNYSPLPPPVESTPSPSAATATPPGLQSPMAFKYQVFYPTAPVQVPPPVASPAPSLSLPPPGMQSPMALAKPSFFPSAGQPPGAVTNVTGVVANVNVVAQFPDQGIAIYSAPSIPFPQAPALPEPLNFIPAFIGLRQQYTIAPLVPVPGTTANVNVNAQFSDSTPAIYQNNNPQQPFSPQLPPSLQFNPSSFALRQQYNTSTPDVFVPGSVANVNVAAPNGTVTELIDGVGQVANVNVVAPAGSIAIYSAPSIQYPQSPSLPEPLNFIPAFIGLRQQYTVQPLVQILGVTANVNVAAPAGGTVIIYPYGLQQPFSAQLPPALQFTPSSYVLRQQYSTATPDVFVPGASANVNVAAQPGSIAIYQNENQPFPFAPLLPPSLQFNPAYSTLRVQSPSQAQFFVGTSISGVVANVNVNAQFSDQGIAIYSAPSLQFPFVPELPSVLQFNSAYIGLRQQYPTAPVPVSLPGATANVNVNAQFPDMGIAIYQNFNPPFPEPPLIPPSLGFNAAYVALRQQYSTALPDVFFPGPAAANVNVVAQAGSITIFSAPTQPFPFPPVLPPVLQFNSSYIALREQFNNFVVVVPGVFVTGVTANVNVTAQFSDIGVIGGAGSNPANVAVASSGVVTISTSTGPSSVIVTAHPSDTIIIGVNGIVTVSAFAGKLDYINNTIWWRVYRGYANWPTW